MKVYRGPASTDYTSPTHEQVDTIESEAIENGVRYKSLIQFNISKDGKERHAVGTAVFEDADFVPLMRGLLARLELQQKALSEIREQTQSNSTADVRLTRIKKILSKL